MFEVIYRCTTREQWYYDSSHDTFEQAVARAAAIHQQTGRGMAVTYQDSPVWSVQQVTRPGVGMPMSPALAYLD